VVRASSFFGSRGEKWASSALKLALLDRDGVTVVNRATNIKRPEDITLIKGAAEGISRLNADALP
jgi:histidinol phosphatase-like enzyme